MNMVDFNYLGDLLTQGGFDFCQIYSLGNALQQDVGRVFNNAIRSAG